MARLRGKVSLVTGSAKGLGAAIAAALRGLYRAGRVPASIGREGALLAARARA